MNWLMSPSVTQVVNALLCSDELYCLFDQWGVAVAGATNAVNTWQREDVTVPLSFRLLHPHAINPQRPYQQAFCTLPSFRSHWNTKMAERWTRWSMATDKWKNRELWTVYLLVQLLRDKIVRFLIKASNLAGLLTSIRQIFPDMEPCQILTQNHGIHMPWIWHTRPLHGNEADAKYRFFCLLGLLCLASCFL